MDGIKFNAIVSKNEIARAIRGRREELEKIYFPVDYVIHRLQEIEDFIGEGNQPSVKDILESDMDI